MYKLYTVPIPVNVKGVSIKKINNHSYVYYAESYVYDKRKKRTIPKTVSIGKAVEGDPEHMFPNENYELYFHDEAEENVDDVIERELNGEDPEGRQFTYVHQEWEVSVGIYIVINRILDCLGIRSILEEILRDDLPLFLDLVCYSIAEESNVAWGYDKYAKGHALFTPNMWIVSDTVISKYQHNLNKNYSQAFLDKWNQMWNKGHKIWLCYDSTDKDCQAGDVDMGYYGHAKDDPHKPIINYAVAYDLEDKKPLYYEYYPGFIADVSQLESTIETLYDYGFKDVGLIIDRWCFSCKDIKYLDLNKYSFIIMIKGKKPLVHDLISQVIGSFEFQDEYHISEYDVNGTTLEGKLYSTDEKKRYFHIYYNAHKAAGEKSSLHGKIDGYEKTLKKKIGKKYEPAKDITKYFALEYNSDGRLIRYAKLVDVINDELAHCGYFVIVTSEKMTAAEALILYKSRNVSENLFRTDKSYLGNIAMRDHTSQGVNSKMFEAFIALILRNEIHVKLQEWCKKTGRRLNYMTAAGALRALDDIKIHRNGKYDYRMAYAISKPQKLILSAFGISPVEAKKLAMDVGAKLKEAAKKDKNSGIYDASVERKSHD